MRSGKALNYSAILLGLACLLLTGTALAGPGDLTNGRTIFSDTDCDKNFTNADQVYTMGIARSAEQDFTARYTLNLGFFASTPAVPVVGGSGAAGITRRSGGVSLREVEYDVDVTGSFTAGTTTLTLLAPAVRFPGDSGAGTTMTITIDLRDGSGPIDLSGVKTRDLAVLLNGCLAPNKNAPTAVDDSASTKEGVAISIDVLSNDSDPDGDTLTVASVTQPTNGSAVVSFSLNRVIYTPASNFEGTDSFSYTVSDGKGGTDTATVTISVMGNTVLLANFLNGNTDSFNSRVYLWNPSQSAGNVTVSVFTLPPRGGLVQELTDTPLNLGTLEAKSALNVELAEDVLVPLGITLPYTDNDGDLTLEFTIDVPNVRGATQVFSSSLAFGTNPLQEIPPTSGTSPTVLVANFTNGNTDSFNSRVYLWNPSQSAGDVTVRFFTLPLTGGTAQELTGTPLSLGTLAAKSALNVKLAEDILTRLGITTPYITDGGNLTLEFTIQAPDVRGAAQVFSSDFAFGVYPLQEIPSTSGISPTVLVANFMNGNDDAFNSRVYLWNPSASPGEVSVRVFTLPLTGGTAQELTGGALNLGRLGAKSALNVKVAEDILRNVGITRPYTDNDGNLTLEFTIQAPDVRGVAQVFSSSFAFGTYSLQEIPSTSGTSPTVLIANFMNGNNDAFNSRIYLWNPSASAGDVTVRVFSLPLTTGVAQELTGAPFDLGTLEARSALNIKLAEDILTPLGIPLPYTEDGGNLTLEFTIGASNVRGAAQVFSDNFTFGTYPMQVVP